MNHITCPVNPANVIPLPTAAAEPVVNPKVPGRRPRGVIHIRQARVRRAEAAYRQQKAAVDLELRAERLLTLGSLQMRRTMLDEEIQRLRLATGAQ